MTKLKYNVGKTHDGQIVEGSLVDDIHLLIGGLSGSGKSVFIDSLLMDLIKESPDDLRLLLIDTRIVMLSAYNEIPHLLRPVVTEVDDAINELQGICEEIDRRYKTIMESSQDNKKPYKDIDEYNKDATEKLARIVIVIDEIALLMCNKSKRKIEKSIVKITSLGRSAGIHLVITTQRVSPDMLTPIMRSNFPTKISMAVATKQNSMILLGKAGAEKLLGRGDMLYQQMDNVQPVRTQSIYISRDEIKIILDNLRNKA